MSMTTDEKYITFKRAEFVEWAKSAVAALDKSAQESGYDEDPRGYPQPLEDAVVIRRQDYFAGPALHSYAHGISLAVKLAAPGKRALELQSIADYFHEQAVLADEEGRKVPD